MPVSRPILIALVLAVVALGGIYATQGGRDASETSAPVVPAEPEPSAEPQAKAPQASAAKAKADRAEGVPPAVQRALRARERVVLFFYRPGSADDRATGRSVEALRGRRDVAVFTDPIGRLGRYRGLIGELGVSQAPAVVIVGRDRAARVVEGYVDPPSLAQDLADAR
jgi:hypothetical protein